MELISLLVYCLYSVVLSTLLLVGLLSAVYFHSPHLILSAASKYSVFQSGFTKRKVSNADYTFSYLERGTPRPGAPSFLFLHGFMSTKDLWAQCFKELPKECHVVLVDLPGHGETTEKDDDDVSHLGMMSRVKQFVDLLGLNSSPFHICGHSMGASIAGLYAHKYPLDVCQLTVICPTIRTPQVTEFGKRLAAGGTNMFTGSASVEDMRALMDHFTYKKMNFPTQLLKGMMEMMKGKIHFYEKVMNAMQLTESSKQLQLHMRDIHTPTQVVWGINDMMLHISGLEALRQGLANCVDAQAISECGHNVHYDQPERLIQSIVNFRDSLVNQVVNTTNAGAAAATCQPTVAVGETATSATESLTAGQPQPQQLPSTVNCLSGGQQDLGGDNDPSDVETRNGSAPVVTPETSLLPRSLESSGQGGQLDLSPTTPLLSSVSHTAQEQPACTHTRSAEGRRLLH